MKAKTFKIQKSLIYKQEARIARKIHRELKKLWKSIITRLETETRSIQSDLSDIITTRAIGFEKWMSNDILTLYMLWPKYVKKALDLNVDLDKINLRAIKYIQTIPDFKPWLIEWSINKTTMIKVSNIISDWLFEWQTYTEIAKTMEKQLDAWLFSQARAETIAVHTVRDAHETGRADAMNDLVRQGLKVKKRWSTVWDNNVTPWCQANESKWQILYKEKFPSWDAQAPRSWNIRCRCTVNYEIE
jgi:hypothetical protein